MSTAMESLQAGYAADPRPIGPDVVGIAGADVPDEFVHAAGLTPLRLRGSPDQATPQAERYLEPAIDPIAKSVFERILDGAYADLERLVLCHDSEASVRLFYYLRELRRIEPARRLPEVYFVDVLHQPARTSTVYNIDRMAAFRDVLAGWSGRPIDDDAVGAAITHCNERRRQLHRLADRRRASPPGLAGTDALVAIGAGMSMDVADYVPLVQALGEEPADGAVDGVRLYVTGTAHDHTGWYEAVEGCGAVIVGENHEHGDLWAETLVDEDTDPMRALAVRYQLGAPASAGYSIDRRAEHTVAAARGAGASGVLCFVRHGDAAPYWDVPEQRRRLAEAGLPMLVVELETYRRDLPESGLAAVRSFVAELAETAASHVRDHGATRTIKEASA